MSGVEVPYTITPVRNAADLADTVSLFRTYAASLGFDLAFQNFDAEMMAMPGKYSPPEGELLLARSRTGVPFGCVGLRPLPTAGAVGGRICEMKRLYVDPTGRGTGMGKALALSIITVAETLGYTEMRLDTLPSMAAALGMYRALGFEDIEAYYETPLQGTHFLSLGLPRQRDHDTNDI